MEAVERGNDFVFFRTKAVVGHTTCELESCFVGFSARVAEEHALGKGRIHQFFGQAQCRLVGEHIGHMPQVVGLLSQRPDQCRMRMAQYVNGNAAREVNQLATRLIPYSGTRTAHRNEGGRCVVRHHDLIEIGALHRGLLNGHRSLLKRNACLNWRAMGGL